MVHDDLEVFSSDAAADCEGVLNPACITALPDIWASGLLIKYACAHIVVERPRWEASLILRLARRIRTSVVVFEGVRVIYRACDTVFA